jgi:molecular chaperone DnaK
VITVPAYFNEVQHSATRDAGVIAGLNVLRLINEPTAAAIAYGVKSGLEPGVRKIYAVYDLGGGTFDVSIIDITAEDITVVGTGGDPRLGGLDMDEEMMKWTLRQIKAKQGIDLHGDDAVRRRLMLEVEGVKKRLVASETTDLIVPFLTTIDGKPFNLKLTITRPQYEMLIQKLLDRSLVCLEEAVASSQKVNQLGWKELDGVLLVGGPTRLQRIRDMLRDRLQEKFREHGCPDKPFEIKTDLNPDEVVALGAAIVTAPLIAIGKPPEDVEKMGAEEVERLLTDKRKAGEGDKDAPEVQIYDVTGHSLGIAAVDEKGLVRFHRIIEKETVIPVTLAHPFTNAADFTTELLVQVFQGESESIELNTKIGEVHISNLVAMPRGEQRLEVKFTLDQNGTLSTICTDLRTQKTYEGTFKFDGITRMSKDEIDRIRARVAAAMADKSGSGAAAGGQGQKGQAHPPGPGAAAPVVIVDFPIDQIPGDWKGYWAMGKDLYPKLSLENQRKLALAMNDFAGAVRSGSAEAIELKGYVMQDTIIEVKL